MTILTPFIILGALGILFALLLGFASKKFEVQVDRRVLKVREMLPGANCGACGFPGCDGLADAIVNKGAPCNSCPVGGKETADKLAAFMGADAVDSAKQVACVMSKELQNMLLKNSNTKVLWIVELTTIFKVEAKLVQTDVWVAELV